MGEPLLFSLDARPGFAATIAAAAGIRLAELEVRDFEDGEHKIRPLEPVRGRDCYLLETLHGEPGLSVNDKLCRLLFLIGALRDAGASRVTLVTPYLAYARKDRRTKPQDPVTSRYLAQLLEAMGMDRLVALEVHNSAALDNAFRRPTLHLEAAPLLAAAALPHLQDWAPVVVSPDPGGAKRADRFRDELEARLGQPLPTAFMEKRRSGGVVSGELLVGAVEGHLALIVDDLISTGGTLLRAAEACRRQGAVGVIALAAHGLFGPGAEALLSSPALDGLLITNSCPTSARQPSGARMELVAVEPLLAAVVRELAQS